MPLLLATLVAFAGLKPENYTPTQDLPILVCGISYLTVTRDPVRNLSLAVVTPDKHLSYLADHTIGTMIAYYWTDDEVSFQINDLYSINYVEGIPTLRKVFQELGTYEFVFSDNLHAEPEDATFITHTITYLGKDHPDCP